MSRVDVLADDRGLQGCFKVANIQQEWAQDFITKHKLVTLDDYIYSVAHDTWEKGVETLVSQVPTLRDNMIALARFRSAFDIPNSRRAIFFNRSIEKEGKISSD